jgi:hypothetical protein
MYKNTMEEVMLGISRFEQIQGTCHTATAFAPTAIFRIIDCHPTAVAVDICSNLYSPQSHACFFSSRARRSAAESSLLDRHQSSAQSDFGISTLFRRNRSRRFLVWVAWAYLCQQHSIVTYLTDKACTGGIDGNSSCQQNVRRLGRVSFRLSLEYRGLRRWC